MIPPQTKATAWIFSLSKKDIIQQIQVQYNNNVVVLFEGYLSGYLLDAKTHKTSTDKTNMLLVGSFCRVQLCFTQINHLCPQIFTHDKLLLQRETSFS